MDTHLGWDDDISICRDFSDLPEDAQEYIYHIEKVAGRQVTYIGVGPDREELIIR
jgi:adenylosuccinate synthase